MEPGKWIRALREDRLLKPSDIERITKNIGETRGNPDFYISHSSLADIELGAIPGIHKLFSLALCLKVSLKELLRPFGIDEAGVSSPGSEPAIDVLALPSLPVRDAGFRFHLSFDTDTSQETTLLKVDAQDLAILPPAIRARFDPIRYRYALIGSKDDSMGDLLPPRSLVEIDITQTIAHGSARQALRERPIYLVWHSEGHTCCWCQVDGRELILIPHPLSHQRIRRFKTPSEATVVGKATNAWLPFESR